MRFFVNHAFLFRARRADQKKKHGARFFFCSVRGGPTTFNHSLARPGVIHSLTGASGGAFFFLLRARWGKFTHSLARPRLCVVGTEGAFFFLLRARRAKQKKKTRGAFFFCSARGGPSKKKHLPYTTLMYISTL